MFRVHRLPASALKFLLCDAVDKWFGSIDGPATPQMLEAFLSLESSPSQMASASKAQHQYPAQ
jgi:hypothetical protein